MFQKLCHGDSGTIIRFEFNHFIGDEILKQFNDSASIKESNQRLDCVYSKFIHTVFELEYFEQVETISMSRYNYFGFHDSEYYVRNTYNIEIYEDSSSNIIFAILEDDVYKHFAKGKNWTKKDWMDHHSSKKIGCFELKCGLLKDRNYFDPAKPVMPGASKTLHEYEKSMFSEDDDYIKEDLYYPSINRNSQYIGNLYPLPTFKPSSGRGNGKSCVQYSLIRTELNYVVYSSQDNPIDDIIGIQENKNQLNTLHVPEGLKRLVEYCMKNTSNEIWQNFEKAERLDSALKLKKIQEKMQIEKEKQIKLSQQISEEESTEEESDDEYLDKDISKTGDNVVVKTEIKNIDHSQNTSDQIKSSINHVECKDDEKSKIDKLLLEKLQNMDRNKEFDDLIIKILSYIDTHDMINLKDYIIKL